MLTIEQLAKLRSLSLKLSHISLEIEKLPKDATAAGREYLNRRRDQINRELNEQIPPSALDDKQLLALIMAPPDELWLNASRSELFRDNLDHWVQLTLSDDCQEQELAELKLLFFFGSQPAADAYIEKYNENLRNKQIIAKIIGRVDL